VAEHSGEGWGIPSPRADILRFFDGFEFLDPGLVYIPQWRPDSPADVPDDPSKFWVLVGVARKA